MAYTARIRISLKFEFDEGKFTLLDNRCVPLGGLCMINSRSTLSSSSERLTTYSVVAFDLVFPVASPLV